MTSSLQPTAGICLSLTAAFGNSLRKVCKQAGGPKDYRDGQGISCADVFQPEQGRDPEQSGEDGRDIHQQHHWVLCLNFWAQFEKGILNGSQKHLPVRKTGF